MVSVLRQPPVSKYNTKTATPMFRCTLELLNEHKHSKKLNVTYNTTLDQEFMMVNVILCVSVHFGVLPYSSFSLCLKRLRLPDNLIMTMIEMITTTAIAAIPP